MPLTLKNVSSAGANAGTEATAQGAAILNKAFEKITGATKSALDSNEMVRKDDSALGTQDILATFDNATPENIAQIKQQAAGRLQGNDLTTEDKARILEASKNAENNLANRLHQTSQNQVQAFTDSNALSTAQADQEQTDFARSLLTNKNAAATVENSNLVNVAKNKVAQENFDISQAPTKRGIAAIENEIRAVGNVNAVERAQVNNQVADINSASAVPAAQSDVELKRIATQNSLNSEREKAADTATIRLIDTTGLAPKPNETLDDYNNRYSEILARTSNITNPDTREAQTQKLLEKNGFNKTQFANRLLESFPRDDKGQIDPIAFGAALNEGGSDGRFAFSDADVKAFMTGKEDVSGETTRKQIATEDRKIQKDIDKQLALQLQKTVSEQEKPGAIQEAVDAVISVGFFSIGDPGQFRKSAQEAYQAGVPFNKIVSLAAQYGNSSTLSNADPEEYDIALKAEISKLNKAQIDEANERSNKSARQQLKDFQKKVNQPVSPKVGATLNTSSNPFNR